MLAVFFSQKSSLLLHDHCSCSTCSACLFQTLCGSHLRSLCRNASLWVAFKGLRSLDVIFIAVQCLFSPPTIINKLACFPHFSSRSDLRAVYIPLLLWNSNAQIALLKLTFFQYCYQKNKSLPVILVFMSCSWYMHSGLIPMSSLYRAAIKMPYL